MSMLESISETLDEETGERNPFEENSKRQHCGKHVSLYDPPQTIMEEQSTMVNKPQTKKSSSDFLSTSDLKLTGISIAISAKEEKVVDEKVREQFNEEFKIINQEARERQKELGKIFMTAVENTQKMLIEVKHNKDKEHGRKKKFKEKDLDEKQEEILRNRALRKLSLINTSGSSEGWGKDVVSFDDATKARVAEMDMMRKMSSEERNKMRRKSSSTQPPENLSSRRTSVGMKTGIREVHTIIVELHNVDLKDESKSLLDALKFKEESEALLLEQLEKQREILRQAAMKKKKELLEALYEEKMRELERIEAERRAREEMERRKRIEAAMRRRQRNLELWKLFNQSKLETATTRINYSYFILLPEKKQKTENEESEGEKKKKSNKIRGKGAK